MNHPKYQGVGVAEDGSQVAALAAANANVTRNKQPATQQMEVVPLVILASDVNVIRMRETDTFSIDASDSSRGTHAVSD